MVSLIQYPKDMKLDEAYSMLLGCRHHRLSTDYAAAIYVVATSPDWVRDGCGLFILFPLVLYVCRLVFEVSGTEIRRYRILSAVSTTLHGIDHRRVWHCGIMDGDRDIYRCQLSRRITRLIFVFFSLRISCTLSSKNCVINFKRGIKLCNAISFL